MCSADGHEFFVLLSSFGGFLLSGSLRGFKRWKENYENLFFLLFWKEPGEQLQFRTFSTSPPVAVKNGCCVIRGENGKVLCSCTWKRKIAFFFSFFYLPCLKFPNECENLTRIISSLEKNVHWRLAKRDSWMIRHTNWFYKLSAINIGV